MDAAAPSAKPKRDTPRIPPNYVSLRHLQELRLKEKEDQRQREEEAAAIRVKAEEEAAARRVKEEEEAAAAASEKEFKTSSRTSFGHKERTRGGQRFVVVAHGPPAPRGEGTAMKKDGARGGYGGKKGSDGDASNVLQGGGGEAENKGKEKVSAGTKGYAGEPAELHGGKPEEKRKAEASVDQGTTSGTSGAPGELAEAVMASSRACVRPQYKRKGKKGSDGRSIETSTTSATGGAADASPPRGVNSESKGKKGSGNWSTETASATAAGDVADASPSRVVQSENKGKKKPSEGRRADAAQSRDSPDRKRAQPRPASEGRSNRRSGGGQGATCEAKSEGRVEKQPVVEVGAQHRPAAEGISNGRSGGGQATSWEAKSEGLGKNRPVMEVRAQPRPVAEGRSNRRSGGGQAKNQEAISEGLGEKQPVVEVRATAQQKPWDARRPARQQTGGGRGNGTAGQHDRVWMPKAAAVSASTEVKKFK